MWQAAPHVAVFIVSPPLKMTEKFSNGEIAGEFMKYYSQREAGRVFPTGSDWQIGIKSQLEYWFHSKLRSYSVQMKSFRSF